MKILRSLQRFLQEGKVKFRQSQELEEMDKILSKAPVPFFCPLSFVSDTARNSMTRIRLGIIYASGTVPKVCVTKTVVIAGGPSAIYVFKSDSDLFSFTYGYGCDKLWIWIRQQFFFPENCA